MALTVDRTPTQEGFKRVQEGMEKYGGRRQAEMTVLFWSQYLGISITVRDLGMLQSLCKIARDRCGIKNNDNLVDIAGWMDVAAFKPEHPPGSLVPADEKGHPI